LRTARVANFLRCPFCGGEFAHRKSFLTCECNAFPILDSIPLLQNEAPQKLTSALAVTARQLRKLQSSAMTFRGALKILCRDREADYLLYRFSDPTFLRTRAVVRAVATVIPLRRPILDLCGGAGHLAFSLRNHHVVLADNAFWKLWLAKRFVAQNCSAVCCDANVPLPFAPRSFSLAVCSDAFHYIWQKRLAASELQRAVGADGTVILAHLHNALWWNYSPGMPLSPAGYAKLFAESEIPFNLGETIVDLSRQRKNFPKEHALTLIATGAKNLFRRLRRRGEKGNTAVNPLYARTRNTLHLKFPSRDYANEFAEAKQYLPQTVQLNGRLSAPGAVLLDLPPKYL
jgi:ubiquinone/menaquinone biosynthesis C-methylase UbiE